jgi:CDGSH-type Zn-finger protein
MIKVNITPDNGPYEVDGPVTIIDAGVPNTTSLTRRPIFLCRCGDSHKPFCDGTQETLNFRAAHRAAGVPAAI